jgi:ParB/RepB/Spo0J family partition protein
VAQPESPNQSEGEERMPGKNSSPVKKPRAAPSQVDVVLLPAEQLRPNDYNPNRMTAEEFQELLAEVRHLKRLPKPVVVRRCGDVYTIVDGEHGWRAAKEAGLKEVPCEVIDADEFEAMRQTYKRNQHGTHDPVLLGRMFRQMIEARSLSARSLAEEIGVSEGTIRNNLIYADAADLRNGYAWNQLSVRQVRAYLSLPVSVGDKWLSAGADLKALDRALVVSKAIPPDDNGVNPRTVQYHPSAFQELIDGGLADGIESTSAGFVSSVHRAFRFLEWKRHYAGYFGPEIDAYLRSAIQAGLEAEWVDRFLPAEAGDGKINILIDAVRWGEIIQDAVERADGNERERDAIVGAAVRVEMRKAGRSTEDTTDPRNAEILSLAEDFVRNADIPMREKIELAVRTARLVNGVPDEEMCLEVQRRACHTLETKHAILSGRVDPDVAKQLGSEVLGKLQTYWSSITVQTALESEIDKLRLDRQLAERDAIFSSPETVVAACLKSLSRLYLFRETQIAGRLALDVLGERLRNLPWPELVFLGAYITGHEMAADNLWKDALCPDDEKEPEDSADHTEGQA